MPIIVVPTSATTVQNLVDRALRQIGQLESGQSATTSETADGITALNALLALWRNERLMCFATQDETLTLVSGTSSYTIGPSGDLVTTRPVAIESAYMLVSNISYPVEIIDNDQYDSLLFKVASATWPDRLNYTPTMGNGTIAVYPVPNGAYTLHMRTRVPMVSFSAGTDTPNLPPGWDDALAFNLAVRIAPEYPGAASSPDFGTVVATARQTKSSLKVMNAPKVKIDNEMAVAFGRHRSRIISDT